LPPSKDKHDYMSLGLYWWPNPDTPDELPYIRRDGQVSPEFMENAYDAASFLQMQQSVRVLALSWYLTGNKTHAEHAARLLRVWFLDSETRMNPDMRFAQGIPGHTEGRAVGIVEAESLRYLPDAIGMLEDSGFWTPEDQKNFKRWCIAFLDWITKDDFLAVYQRQPGHNNIAIGMDTLVMALALYTGQDHIVRNQINHLVRGRIAAQIAPDGRLPHELQRTLSFSYSIKALNSFFIAARLAEHVDIDLWNCQGPEGQSIRKALDFLIPFLYEPRKWPCPQIKGLNDQPAEMGRHLLPLAIRAWQADAHKNAYKRISGQVLSQRERFLYCNFFVQEDI
jgi:hypothetical protein